MLTEHTHIYKAIDEILWNEWDPIGVNNSAPRNEYYGYLPIIFDLKLKNATRESIAQKLFELETKNMGLDGNIDHCRKIADKIISLK
jgi:hypothetical protein